MRVCADQKIGHESDGRICDGQWRKSWITGTNAVLDVQRLRSTQCAVIKWRRRGSCRMILR